MARDYTVKFWIGTRRREACKARAHAAGITLVMEDTQYLYYRVHAATVRAAENLVYDAAEGRME